MTEALQTPAGPCAFDVVEIVEKHLIGGEVVTRLLQPDQPQLGDRRAFGAVEVTR